MAEQQYQPLYSAKEKSPINFMLILGLGAAVADILISGGISGLFVVGLGVATYSWFTSPTNYTLYNDRLLISYGRPRVRHVMFENIEGVDNLVVPLSGPRLRVREFRGDAGVWLTPRDPDTFMEQFRIAMEAFQGTTPENSESGFVPFQREQEGQGEALPEGKARNPQLRTASRKPLPGLSRGMQGLSIRRARSQHCGTRKTRGTGASSFRLAGSGPAPLLRLVTQVGCQLCHVESLSALPQVEINQRRADPQDRERQYHRQHQKQASCCF